LVKANIGGSGAGITRFDDEMGVLTAAEEATLDFGVDGVALVQELAPLKGGHITRIEVLGGRFLYAINVYPAADSYNLCPADVCQTTDGRALTRSACALDAPKNGMRVERATPTPAVIAEVERIAEYVGLDVGGIEMLVDERDGRHYYYDVNALSNFVADARNVVGFDPHERLVNYLLDRVGAAAMAGGR
jgi:glutathione synthase/RimK-type ligase-like ATP-grasp enzyme